MRRAHARRGNPALFLAAALLASCGFPVRITTLGGKPAPGSGSVAWARAFGASGGYLWTLAVGPQGDLFASGTYLGQLDLGGSPQPCSGADCLYVPPFSPAG